MASASSWAQFSEDLAHTVEAAGQSVVALVSDRGPAASGTFWQERIIVTANHAARHDELTAILPGGTSVPARLKGRDQSTDLAIFNIETAEGRPANHREAELRVGNLVLALARTGRGNVSASAGIISGLMGAWQTWQGGQIDRFIRPDLTLYRGYSGGPLVNAKGEIVGINTSGLRRGTPVAIPTNTVQRVVQELLEQGHIARPYLGVALQPASLPEDLISQLNIASRVGLLIVHVENDGPAAQAGLMLGDIVVEIGGKPIAQRARLHSLLGNQKVGEKVELGIVRSGERRNIAVTLGDRAEQ